MILCPNFSKGKYSSEFKVKFVFYVKRSYNLLKICYISI